MSVTDFKNLCREAFKDNLLEGNVVSDISTGSYDVDRAYGGGLRRGRFHLWAGKESTGKTSLALHTMREANSVNWTTGERDLTFSDPSPVLFVDLEGTFDEVWATKIGIDPNSLDDYNYVARPSHGEMAADIVLRALESETFALVIVDSNEAFVAASAIEKSAGDHVMCDRAKILSRMYRVGQAHLNRAVKLDKPWQTPTVLCLNQLRDKIGGYGGGSVIPGGIAQRQYSSTIAQFNSPLVADDSVKAYGMGEFKGVTKKNKTAPPKKNFKFRMALRDLTEGGGLAAGQIDNATSILADVKALGHHVKLEKGGYEIMGDEYRIQNDFKEKLNEDPEFQRKIWTKLIQIDRT